MSRELDSDDPTENYRAFLLRIGHLLEVTRWNYQAFVSAKIDMYFEKVEKLSSYVSDFAKKVGDAIDAITKGLTDALLALIGVVVVTLVAAIAKKDTSRGVFKVLLFAYSGYLFFYAIYKMASGLHSYLLLSTDANAEIDFYEGGLGKMKTAAYRRAMKRRAAQFNTWFWITAVLYLALTALSVVAAYKLPDFLVNHGVLGQPATNPGPSPTP